MRSFIKYSRGFTLVELMVYTAVFVVTAGLLTGILITISGSQTRENAAFEVTRQLQFVTQKIQYSVRDASNIVAAYEGNNSENPCVTFCSLKLRVTNSALDPTIFSSDVNGVYMKEGSNTRVLLTTSSVKISSLKFTTVANPGGLSTVTIDLSLSYNSNEARLSVVKRLTSAIAHVSAATFDSDLLPDSTDTRNIGNSSSRWQSVTAASSLNVVNSSAAAGDSTFFTSARGTTDGTTNGAVYGATNINQYYTAASPYNKFGAHFNVGNQPVLYLEGDFSQTTRRVYFMNSNIGIGTNSPAGILDVDGIGHRFRFVDGSQTTLPVFSFIDDTSYTHAGTNFYIEDADNTASRLTFDFRGNGSSNMILAGTSAGNVGIGNTAPGYKLDVTGDLRITGTPYRTGGDTAWQVPSDARLKNISSLYEKGLKAILTLNPVRYHFKPGNAVGADSSKEYIGIIAQEAQKVIPEAVSMEKNGYLSLNTTPIFWTIINAIKDLSKSDDEMAKTITSQNETIQALTRRIEILEKNDSNR